MLKRELKVNLKSFIIWISILFGIFLLVYIMYPFIINSGEIDKMNEMMEVFPKEMLEAFNMDISSVDSAFGWLKTEGFIFVLLIIGCYSGILGTNILLKEENDKTIEYLNSLPIKRESIVLSRIICGLIYIVLMVLLLCIFNYVGLYLSGKFDEKTFFLLSMTPIFSSIVIFSLSMFLSTFTNKTKKMLGISLGIVFISYIINIFSTLSKKVEFLKYLSVFTLADIRNVIKNVSINPIMMLISVCLSLIFFILTIFVYKRKELI